MGVWVVFVVLFVACCVPMLFELVCCCDVCVFVCVYDCLLLCVLFFVCLCVCVCFLVLCIVVVCLGGAFVLFVSCFVCVIARLFYCG